MRWARIRWAETMKPRKRSRRQTLKTKLYCNTLSRIDSFSDNNNDYGKPVKLSRDMKVDSRISKRCELGRSELGGAHFVPFDVF